MERAKNGEQYFTIDGGLLVHGVTDLRKTYDDNRFEIGNYFHTKEEAEALAEKIRAVLKGAWVLTPPEGESFSRKVEAVLKGAEVIEMPSEEEMQTLETKDIVMAEFLEESLVDLAVITHGRHAYWKGWNAAIRWLKSKIVK